MSPATAMAMVVLYGCAVAPPPLTQAIDSTIAGGALTAVVWAVILWVKIG